MTRRGRTVSLVVGSTLLIALLFVAYLLPVPYVRLRPGPVFNALGEVGGKPVVAVEGAQTFPTTGSLDVTTVYEDGSPGTSVTLLQAFRGWLDSSMTVVPRDLLYSPEQFNQKDAAEQSRQEGVVQMQGSEEAAVVAALRYVSEPVHLVVTVDSVVPDTPADGELEAGDVIVKVDGVPIKQAGQVRTVVSKLDPGGTVTFVIKRDGQRHTVSMETAPATDDPSRPMVGIIPTISYDSPVHVNIELADVGGPSAGLMFSLSTVDKLTSGSLTGGQNIAGTGTISARGRVGPIGGIAQKMAGARAHSADYFLAPGSNCSEVIGHIPAGLHVVRVDSLPGAVNVLDKIEHGVTDLPGCAA